MGVRGTDVAKEAAAIVLMDDNFNSIVAAVAEGRAIFENIRKFVVYLISCNRSELFDCFFGHRRGGTAAFIAAADSFSKLSHRCVSRPGFGCRRRLSQSDETTTAPCGRTHI